MIFVKKYNKIILIILSVILYFFFGYFLERTQFELLLFLWILLFIAYYYLLEKTRLSFKTLVAITVFFRLIFLFAIPNLSQDFYRFIWDGRMILEGLNPYLSLPQTFIEQRIFPVSNAQELYAGMGKLNGSNYTNYPPLNQLNFLIAAIFANKSIFWSVVILRLQIIAADIGIIYFGAKLLKNINLKSKAIFWYLLNPFVIIELTGNLHFEAVMLFFLVWSLYKLQQRKWVVSAILLACSVSVKLIPLIFLPLFYQWFVTSNSSKNDNVVKWTEFKFRPKEVLKLLVFYLIVIGVSVLLFLPFYSSELINNYTNSVGLWFKKFEFNASFYYIFREIGYQFRDWNEIAIIGKIIPVITLVFLLGISFFRKNTPFKNLITALLFGLSFYYFTTTTMHPWYLATLVLLSVFTQYKFPIVWSLVIVLSYQAYANIPWKENLWVVSLEYLIVYGFLTKEFVFKKEKVTLTN